MNKLSVIGLTKSFGEKRLFSDLSFSFEGGEIIGLLGSSGSGKSTLLRCLCQLDIPDHGSIEVDGQCLNRSNSAAKNSLGMVFQQYHLWPHLNVLSNLSLAPRHVLKHPKETVKARAYELLHMLGIAHKDQSYPPQLSGGEQQRVAIARALMMQPKGMLFDEPTSALDPERSRQLADLFRMLSEQGMGLLIATHDIPFIQSVAHQVLFLEGGQIQERTPVQAKKIQAQTARFTTFLQEEIE